MCDLPEGVKVSRYTVCAVPESVPGYNRHHWEITVEDRGDGRWAVLHHGFCFCRRPACSSVEPHHHLNAHAEYLLRKAGVDRHPPHQSSSNNESEG